MPSGYRHRGEAMSIPLPASLADVLHEGMTVLSGRADRARPNRLHMAFRWPPYIGVSMAALYKTTPD